MSLHIAFDKLVPPHSETRIWPLNIKLNKDLYSAMFVHNRIPVQRAEYVFVG